MTHSLPREVVALLSSTSDVILGRFGEDRREEVVQRVAGADAILLSGRDVMIDEALISRCPSLRIIAATFKAPEIDLEACTRSGVWVTTALEALMPPAFNEAPALWAALEAAANILEALTGSAPGGAINGPFPNRPRQAALL